ncbi:MAG: hypothetical protein Q4G35_01705 [Propionibacteriaceae bacterium]|nr:hypothetical protein [Propionibacteriaceae bacterium]
MARISKSQLLLAVVKSAAWAGITLIDPNKLTGWRKHAYWATMAGGSAAEIARPMPSDGEYRSPGLTTGIALGVAGATYGAQDLLARGDAWSIGLLRKLGLKHPRRWAAGAVFASMLASLLAEAKLDDWEPPQDDGYDEFGQPLPETLEPLPTQLRAALISLLDAVDGYGSDELREQLADAVCRPFDGQFLLVVDKDAPRTLLNSYTFPASAIFQQGGLNHVLMLEIEDGVMSFVSHHVEPYPEDESIIDWSLAAADELEIVVGFEETEAAL